MESIKYELKYCEGCGTLKLRPVNSPTSYCKCCERLMARFGFSRAGGVKSGAALPNAAELKIMARIPLAACGGPPTGRAQ